jgi:hypothetical protein
MREMNHGDDHFAAPSPWSGFSNYAGQEHYHTSKVKPTVSFFSVTPPFSHGAPSR